MISTSFINECREYDGLIDFINNQWGAINPLMETYNSLVYDISNLCMFNESTTEKEEEKVKVSKSFVDKIGETVIGIVKKIKEILEKLMRTVNEKLWNKKTDMQKLQKIMHEYPELKDQILISVNQGDLDIRDIKSMQDLTDGTIDLMEKLKLGKIDESEFDKKFNGLYNKYKKYGKPVIDVVAGVSAVVGLAITLKKFRTDWLKSEVDGQKLYVQKQERKQVVVKEIIEQTATNIGQNAASIELRAWSQIQSENGKNMSGLISLINRIAGRIETIVASSDKLSHAGKTSTYRKIFDNSDRLSHINTRKTRENSASYADDMRRAEAQARGRIQGERHEGIDHNKGKK